MQARNLKIGLGVTLLLVAAGGRLVPHPPNFTPVGAMGLYSGARFSTGQAISLVLLAMLLSDWLLQDLMGVGGSGAVGSVVYLSLTATVLIGRWAGSRPGLPRLLIAILGTSTLFFLTTNLAVWLFEGIYPKDWNGLVGCYIAAVPFYQNHLLGDLTWGLGIFSLEFLAKQMARRAVPFLPKLFHS